MKEIEMNYGQGAMKASIEEKDVLQVIESNPFKQDKTEEEVIEEALLNPIDSRRLKDIVHEGETVCIIISDITRSWQKPHKFLYKIVEELNAGGIKDEDIIFLSAQGTHRKQTRKEHELLLGEKLAGRFQVYDHDCFDEESMTYLGDTSYGTPVIVNKKAVECDHIVLTGAIIYHFLVGWSGGKKSILPGISSFKSISANHSLSLNEGFGTGGRKEVCSGNIVGNPIHNDMLEAAAMVKPSFMFNVIMGPDGNIAGAVAGNYITAHEAGRKLVDSIDGVNIKEKSDIVIASAGGYPKDINLYQSIKTLMNAKEAVADGGTMIILTQCKEGIGESDDVKHMILDFDNMLDREKDLRENYTISKYVGYFFCECAEKYKLILVSEIEPALLSKTKIILTKTLEEALKIAYDGENKNATINLMPHGATTLPRLAE
ncbi:nickel-dependent lactate racemase [Clostridium sp. 19966]|uniref:nickel-dependent lactate racemase n=1 Tax=Clostridium sp. 19966 TaxID=2768166 RepID=UPI0028DEB597|nr:nickel-dependent lactate racemase [Clostridium sp. 19966]MDT8719538.1 nickel-dependent lactate racemase [Clostridium sp. 19966]